MTTRRSFLTSIIATGCAPAIVKAENIGKIFVPKTEIIVPTYRLDDLLVSEVFFPTMTMLFGINLDVCTVYPIGMSEKDYPPLKLFYFDFDGVNHYDPTKHLTT